MNISPAVSRSAHTVLRQVQHHSPAILTTAGIVGVVGAAVMAAKATLSLESTLDLAREEIEAEFNLIPPGEDLETSRKKLQTRTYVKNALRVGKLYAPSATLMLGSIAALIAAQGIMRQRNIALVAAYKSLETAFKAYRERVVEEYGETVDEDFRSGTKRVVETDPDTKKKTKSIESVTPGSEFIYDFGINNPNWQGFRDQNEHFLRTVQAMFNERLKRRGYIFLHEVLDTLGLPYNSESAAVTGWVFDPTSPKGDNYIDFRVKDLMDTNGYYMLDFNVDGIIIDHFNK